MATRKDKPTKARASQSHIRPSVQAVNQATSAENLVRSDRDKRLIELRRKHWTYDEIIDHLVAEGYDRISKVRAVQIVQKHLQDNMDLIDSNIAILRREEVERLDTLAKALEPATQPRPVGIDPDGKTLFAPPDLESIDRYLKVRARLAQLQGLDMPVKVAPTDPGGTNPYDGALTDARQRLADLLASKLAGK